MRKILLLCVMCAYGTVSLAACQKSGDTGADAFTEQSLQENADNVAEERADDTKEVKSETDDSYATAEGIKFEKLGNLSPDFYAVLVDKNHNEINDDDNQIMDKESEWAFDVVTYPAEKEGYTTACISILAKSDFIYKHNSRAESWVICDGSFNLFDRYSGIYISTPDVEDVNGKDYENTSVTYKDNDWDLTANRVVDDWVSVKSKMILGEDAEENEGYQMGLYKFYATYPSDYDGLAFCISDETSMTIDEIEKVFDESDKEFDPDDVGKKILEASDIKNTGGSTHFYSLNDPDSVTVREASSEEEAGIRNSWHEWLGLEISDNTEGIELPYSCSFFDGDTNIKLGDNEAKPRLGKAAYVFGEVIADEDGDTTKLTIPFEIKMNIMTYAEGVYMSWICEGIDVFDRETGKQYETSVVEDETDGEWGDWDDEGYITYAAYEKMTDEVSVPTDKLEDLFFVIGDVNGKPGEDYYAFTYDALVK